VQVNATKNRRYFIKKKIKNYYKTLNNISKIMNEEITLIYSLPKDLKSNNCYFLNMPPKFP
jgi:hypothetical protein